MARVIEKMRSMQWIVDNWLLALLIGVASSPISISAGAADMAAGAVAATAIITTATTTGTRKPMAIPEAEKPQTSQKKVTRRIPPQSQGRAGKGADRGPCPLQSRRVARLAVS